MTSSLNNTPSPQQSLKSTRGKTKWRFFYLENIYLPWRYELEFYYLDVCSNCINYYTSNTMLELLPDISCYNTNYSSYNGAKLNKKNNVMNNTPRMDKRSC